jgi:hypothetical protein
VSIKPGQDQPEQAFVFFAPQAAHVISPIAPGEGGEVGGEHASVELYNGLPRSVGRVRRFDQDD